MSNSRKLAFSPLYQQVKESIVARIVGGEWAPGTFLPSESVLAREYNVAHGTLRRALDTLTREKRLIRYQGKGTAVAILDSDQVLFRFFRLVRKDNKKVFPCSQFYNITFGKGENGATAEEAKQLKIVQGCAVLRLERVRLLDATPVVNECIVIPSAKFPGIEHVAQNLLPNTLYDYYQRQYQVTVVTANDRIEAVASNAIDAKHLNVPLGSPLLLITRVAFSWDGTPVEYRTSRVNTAFHQYANDLA